MTIPKNLIKNTGWNLQSNPGGLVFWALGKYPLTGTVPLREGKS